MNGEPRRGTWRWLRHVIWVTLLIVSLAAGTLIFFFGSGAGNPLIRRTLVKELERATGGTVEVRSVSIRWLALRARLEGVVIHGKEPAGTEPLFSAEEIEAALRIDSYWGRRASLSELIVKQPRIHVRVEQNGTSNVPAAKNKEPGRPLRETLFDLEIGHLQLEDGWIRYNDVQRPLVLEARDVRLVFDAGGSGENAFYLGTFDSKALELAWGRNMPVSFGVSSRFTVRRNGFAVDQAQISTEHSRFDLQAEMNDFSDPKWMYRVRGWVNFLDFRRTLRLPNTPEGKIEIRAEGTFARGQILSSGNFLATEVTLRYPIFRAAGLHGRGNFRLDNQNLYLSDLNVSAFGGSVRGKATMRMADFEFRAETHLEGIRIAQVFPAAERRGFPIDDLHWEAAVSGDTVETWAESFRRFVISGKTEWAPPAELAAGRIPVTGTLEFRYQDEAGRLTVPSAHLETPTSRIEASGVLARRDSALDVKFETGALESYADFILAIEGGEPETKAIHGSAKWDGQITGPWSSPSFAGHVRGEQLAYGDLRFDLAEGDVQFGSAGLSVAHGHAKQGLMAADLEAQLTLTDWSFLPDDAWSADINLEKVPLESLEQFAGQSYPVEGLLTGQFHGKGTRREPTLTGLFDLGNGKAYGLAFERLRGQLNVGRDELRLSNAELRIFAPGKENGSGAGIVTGNIAYRISDKNISAELVGAGLPLESFDKLQTPKFPLFGRLTFHINASGPLRAPLGDGTFRVVDLRVGQQVIGSFEGKLNSDGNEAKLELTSAMTNGSISGEYTIGLRDPYPIRGKAKIENIKLDPFMDRVFHLPKFAGHGTADGEVSVDGSLKQPDSLTMEARFSRLVIEDGDRRLQNEGPLHFRSSSTEFSLDPVTFKGAHTNLRVGGSIRLAGRRSVNFSLNGDVDLAFLNGYYPQMDTRGLATINASFEGTIERPRITGRVHVDDAAVRPADMPVGLSAIKGDVIFDATRLYFDNITAQEGGGTLTLTGSVSYADTPLRYDVSLRTDQVRVRYPEGMSWLVGGNLRLTGTPQAGVLSGKVTVDHVALSGGLEVAGALVASGTSGGASTSSFLRNLQFDIEAGSSPDARLEWPNAELEADANLRVRGTWEHPILLGHIHVLSGELLFRGNRYRVSRGDLNFANPFQLNPDVNVEATTTIQQYEITLNFSGLANKLTLSYRSDPPLPSNDIITLLAVGQTTSEAELRGGGTGATQSASMGASALLTEAISSQVGGRLERLFGITKLRVDPGLTGVGATGSEQNAAARVTVQQQIARDFTITYVTNVSSTQQQVIQIEYNVTRNVSIVALRDYNGTFGIDVKITKRFQ